MALQITSPSPSTSKVGRWSRAARRRQPIGEVADSGRCAVRSDVAIGYPPSRWRFGAPGVEPGLLAHLLAQQAEDLVGEGVAVRARVELPGPEQARRPGREQHDARADDQRLRDAMGDEDDGLAGRTPDL